MQYIQINKIIPNTISIFIRHWVSQSRITCGLEQLQWCYYVIEVHCAEWEVPQFHIVHFSIFLKIWSHNYTFCKYRVMHKLSQKYPRGKQHSEPEDLLEMPPRICRSFSLTCDSWASCVHMLAVLTVLSQSSRTSHEWALTNLLFCF